MVGPLAALAWFTRVCFKEIKDFLKSDWNERLYNMSFVISTQSVSNNYAICATSWMFNTNFKLEDSSVYKIEINRGDTVQSTLNNPENGYITFPKDLVTVVDSALLPANPYEVVSDDSALSADAKQFFSSLDFRTGITSGDGVMNIHPFVGVWNTFNFSPSKDGFDQKFITKAAEIMFGDHIPDVVTDMIKHKYTNWSNPEAIDNVRQTFLDMTGHCVFNLNADMHANLSSSSPKRGNTYMLRH